ncbi:MAG: FxLYD domain-containing protein [Acidobacteriota bacterium]
MSEAQPNASKPTPNLWLAILPGILVFAGASGMFLYSSREFSSAGAAITAPDPKDEIAASKPSPGEMMSCIETYGVTMSTSESYVRESNGFPQSRPKNSTGELSTVLRGMIRNNCGRPLRRVEVFMEVRDADGNKGAGWAAVGHLEHGQAEPFERAWMGRITEYKVTKAR